MQLCLPTGHVLRVYPYMSELTSVSSPKWYLQFPFRTWAICNCTNNMSLFLLATFCTGTWESLTDGYGAPKQWRSPEKERGSTGKPLSGSSGDWLTHRESECSPQKATDWLIWPNVDSLSYAKYCILCALIMYYMYYLTLFVPNPKVIQFYYKRFGK